MPGVPAPAVPSIQPPTPPVSLTLGPAEARWVTVALRVPPETAARTPPGAHEIHFTITRQATPADDARSLREKSTFVLPR